MTKSSLYGIELAHKSSGFDVENASVLQDRVLGATALLKSSGKSKRRYQNRGGREEMDEVEINHRNNVKQHPYRQHNLSCRSGLLKTTRVT